MPRQVLSVAETGFPSWDEAAGPGPSGARPNQSRLGVNEAQRWADQLGETSCNNVLGVLTSTCFSATHRNGEEKARDGKKKSKVTDHFKVKGNRKGKVWRALLKRLLVSCLSGCLRELLTAQADSG